MELAKLEAAINADIYNPGTLIGPFVLQQHVQSYDSTIYYSEYIPKTQTLSIKTGNYDESMEYVDIDALTFLHEDQKSIKTQIFRNIHMLEEFLERHYNKIISKIKVAHTFDNKRNIILLFVSDVEYDVWHPVKATVTKPSDVIQQCTVPKIIQLQTTVIAEDDHIRVNDSSDVKLPKVRKTKPVDRAELKNQNFQFLRRPIPEKLYHIYERPRDTKSTEFVEASKQLAEAREEIVLLARKATRLEGQLSTNGTNVAILNDRLEAAQQEQISTFKVFSEKRKHDQDTIKQLREEIDVLNQRVRELTETAHQSEERNRTVTEQLSTLQQNYDELLDVAKEQDELVEQAMDENATAVVQQIRLAEGRANELELTVTDLNTEIRSLRKQLDQQVTFHNDCYKYLADPNTPGVMGTKRCGGGFTECPMPRDRNVRVVVNALMSGQFIKPRHSNQNSSLPKVSKTKTTKT